MSEQLQPPPGWTLDEYGDWTKPYPSGGTVYVFCPRHTTRDQYELWAADKEDADGFGIDFSTAEVAMWYAELNGYV